MTEERMRILRLLEQGVITYEQSLALLQALGDEPARSDSRSGGLGSDGAATGNERLADHGQVTARYEAADDDDDDDDDEDEDEDQEDEDQEDEDDEDGDEDDYDFGQDASEPLSSLRDSLGDAGQQVRSAMREVSRELHGVSGEVAGELRKAMREVRQEVGEAMRGVGSDIREAIGEASDGEGWNLLPGLFGMHYTFHESEEIPVEASVQQLRLVIGTKNGSIRVLAGDVAGLQVRTVKRIQAESKRVAAEIAQTAVQRTLEQGDDLLTLTLVVPEEVRGAAISFEVTVPRQLAANLHLWSKNGSIQLEDQHGTADIESKNGALRITGGSYDLVKAIAKNGSVHLLSAVESASLESKNGSVRCLVKPQGKGRLNAHSYNGSVTIELPDATDIGYRLEAETVHGSVHAHLTGFVANESGKRRLLGQTEDFDQRAKQLDIRASTKNGSVNVRAL